MQQFQCTTRILSGRNALEALGNIGSHRVMLVTDRFFRENGTAERIAGMLRDCECSYFSDVLPDPEVTLVARGCAELSRVGADVVIALGGGSVLDCAKAMAYFSKTRPTLIAIPTTSGTGAEVTSFSILTHGGVKHPLVDARLRPDWAILDESLLTTLPPALVADAGMDLISHALEAVCAKNATPFTDSLAVGALQIALRYLPESYGGETAHRGDIHTAAAMAGLAFDRAGLGACHALSHALGGRFHVAHGRLNAVLLPAVMAMNAPAALPRYAGAARACGLGYSIDQMAFRSLSAQLRQLRRTLGLPQTLAGASISYSELTKRKKALIEAALADPCMNGNPITPTAEQLNAILEEVAQ